MKRLLHIVGISALFTSVAYGHGGHGATEGTALVHYLIEPAHGLAALALIAVALAAWKRRVPARQQRH